MTTTDQAIQLLREATESENGTLPPDWRDKTLALLQQYDQNQPGTQRMLHHYQTLTQHKPDWIDHTKEDHIKYIAKIADYTIRALTQ
jgi:hypothetical protein